MEHAPAAPALRATDFLPDPKFSGESICHEKAISHWFLFTDYLQMHGLQAPAPEQMPDVTIRFRLSLSGEARLWVQGKVFANLDGIKDAFLHRFSPRHSEFANVKFFDELCYRSNESAEQYLGRVRIAAQRINYDDVQIRNKFLHSLPAECQRAIVMAAPPGADADQLATLAQQYIDLTPGPALSASTKVVSFTDEVHATCTSTPGDLKSIREDLESLQHGIKELNVQFSQQDKRYRDTGNNSRSPSPRRSRYRPELKDRRYHRSPSPSRPRTPSRDRDQPDRRGNDPQTRQSCFFCGKPGHVWRRCWHYLKLEHAQPERGNAPPSFQENGARPDRQQGGYATGSRRPQWRGQSYQNNFQNFQ